jgi:hypothetical protein
VAVVGVFAALMRYHPTGRPSVQIDFRTAKTGPVLAIQFPQFRGVSATNEDRS